MKRLRLFIPMVALVFVLFAACGSPEEIARETGATAAPTKDIFAASTGRKPAEARGRTSDRTSTRATPAVRGESARESSNRARPTPGVNLNEVRATPLPPAPEFVKAWENKPKLLKLGSHAEAWYENYPSFAEGEFYQPIDIAVAYDGSVYVSDFGHPDGLQVDVKGNLYIPGESGFRRIQKSTSDGEFTQYLAITHAEETKKSCRVPSCSVGIATGPDGIFVLDDSKHALMEFTSDGVYKGNFDLPYWLESRTLADVAVGVDGNVYILVNTVSNLKSPVGKFTSEGVIDESWNGSWQKSNGYCYCAEVSKIAVGPDGSVYVVYSGYYNIARLGPDGNFISKFGTNGTGPGEFKNGAGDIAVAPDGSVYVVDPGNYRIQKFTSDGVFVTYWGSKGDGEGEFSMWRKSIAVAPDGSVYVAESGNHRIQKFSPGS